MKLYLDSSVILKRYLSESGTENSDVIFDKAGAGELTLAVSVWNIGEVLGVLDAKRRQGWLDENEFKTSLNSFADEFVKLIRLKSIEILPVFSLILTDAWRLLMKYHIYEADALQISSCLYGKSEALISGDDKLVEVSRKVGLQAFSVIKEGQKILSLL